MSHSVSQLDPQSYREALGLFASGVTIISGVDGEGPVGFTCQSFYSVSLEPPLVSFSVMANSTSYPRIRDSGRFAVNVLSHEQRHISNQFAKHGTDKWAGISWSPSAAGNPVIDDTLMWLDCRIQQQHRSGDHDIVVGRVLALGAPGVHTAQPLLFFNGRYRHLRDLGER